MEEKIKQRLIGVLVFIGALFIILPFLFHNPNPMAQKNLSTKIPNPPAAQSVTLELPAIKPSTTQAPTPVLTAPTVATINAAPIATIKPPVAAPAATTQQKTTPTITQAPAAPVAPQQTLKQPSATPPQSKSVATAKSQPAPITLTQNPEAWTIQLGVFSSQENAKELMMKLRKEHFDAYTRTVMRDKNKLTAIYVGPEINKQKIELTQNNLEKQFHMKGVIRKYQL